MKPHHFYVAFNPFFNEDRAWKTQAHEFYHSLKDKKKQNPAAYMYWGKIQVSEYSEPLKREHFEQVIQKNNEDQLESHLYVTDYQHLWVGKVSQVLNEIQDPENALNFYKEKKVEMWFKVEDFELISNQSTRTLEFLSQIYVDNNFYSYKIKEMTPFTSGIRFPMIVQDHTEVRYFNQEQLRVLSENSLVDGSGEEIKLNSLIHSFVIPEENFKRLPETFRNHITHAEILLLEAQSGGKKDRAKLEQAILTYLECLEGILNETFVAYLKRMEGHRIWVTKDRKFLRSALDKDKSSLIKLKDFNDYFNLSQIKMLLDTPGYFGHTTLDHIFQGKPSFWEYCRLELRSVLKNESLIELRNLLSSPGQVKAHDRELMLVRNILLGVGGQGVFNQVIESWYDSAEVKLRKMA